MPPVNDIIVGSPTNKVEADAVIVITNPDAAVSHIRYVFLSL